MKTRFALPACLILCVFSVLLTGAAGGVEPSRRGVFADAAELGQPVTCSETKISLSELLQKVAADTGVKLTAAADVADEPVTVVVKGMRAHELLEQLADLLDYRWSRRGKEGEWRYEIWQDLASKQREAALRQEVAAEGERQFQAAVKHLLELAVGPPEQIRQLLEEWERHAREVANMPAEQQEALRDSVQEWDRIQKVNAAQYLWSPIGRALAQLLPRLTHQQWALLRQDEPLILSTEPRSGELPLPMETAQALRSSALQFSPPWLSPTFPDEQRARFMRQSEKKAQEEWAGASGFAVTVYLERSPLSGSLELTMNALPLQDGAPVPSFWGGGGSFLQLHSGPLRRNFQQLAEENTTRRQAELERDPLLGARKRFRPAAKPEQDSDPPGGVWQLQELLPELAHTYGVQFLSDAYYWNARPISARQLFPTQPVALYALLDRLVGNSYRWDHRGRVVRLRSRNWFIDRPREIPLRLVRQWRKQCNQHGVLPLPEQLALLTVLKEEQWSTVDLFLATLGETQASGTDPFMPDRLGLPPQFVGSREALQMLAAVTPAQQKALWQGKTIRMAALTPVQYRLFLAPFQAGQRIRFTQRQVPEKAPDEDASGLTVVRQPLLLVRERRGRRVSYRIEAAAPAPTATPAAEAGGARARLSPLARGRQRSDAGRGSPSPVPEPRSLTRYPITQLELHFGYGPDHRERRSIMVPSSP